VEQETQVKIVDLALSVCITLIFPQDLIIIILLVVGDMSVQQRDAYGDFINLKV
jgi:hypothetical protein